MNFTDKLKKGMCIIMSLCIAVLAVFCVSKRAQQVLNISTDTALASVFFTMPDGSFDRPKSKEKSVTKPKKSDSVKNEQSQKIVSDTVIDSNEATYPVREIDLSSDTKLYDNISLNNKTSYTVDPETLLKDGLPFEISDTREAQVLIVHTHTCESYLPFDSGFYYESFYPRTTDNENNVFAVGEAISKSLKAKGIGVVHAKTQHDHPSYDGAYDRSFETIQNYLSKYPSIKVVLDIHRDSMTQDDMTRLKPTFTYNGEKAAQIMIMTGHDSSYTHFPTWEDNLKFALLLQNTCETMYTGMTRPLNFGDFTYNMNANSGSLLIEVGTDANTLSEAVLSGELLGNALSEVLQNS